MKISKHATLQLSEHDENNAYIKEMWEIDKNRGKCTKLHYQMFS